MRYIKGTTQSTISLAFDYLEKTIRESYKKDSL